MKKEQFFIQLNLLFILEFQPNQIIPFTLYRKKMKWSSTKHIFAENIPYLCSITQVCSMRRRWTDLAINKYIQLKGLPAFETATAFGAVYMSAVR